MRKISKKRAGERTRHDHFPSFIDLGRPPGILVSDSFPSRLQSVQSFLAMPILPSASAFIPSFIAQDPADKHDLASTHVHPTLDQRASGDDCASQHRPDVAPSSSESTTGVENTETPLPTRPGQGSPPKEEPTGYTKEEPTGYT